MSILTGPAISDAIAAGQIIVDPMPPWKPGPNSLDLRLGSVLKRYENGIINPYAPPALVDVPRDPVPMEMLHSGFSLAGGWLLQPGVLYLGQTLERTYTPFHVPRLDGRSSTGRLGLFVHVTAGLGDVGFDGHWVVELIATHPIFIAPGMALFQISFDKPIGVLELYSGRYGKEDAVSLGVGR